MSTCTICLDPLYERSDDGDFVEYPKIWSDFLSSSSCGAIALKCGHLFHKVCMAQFASLNFEESRRCPLCRQYIGNIAYTNSVIKDGGDEENHQLPIPVLLPTPPMLLPIQELETDIDSETFESLFEFRMQFIPNIENEFDTDYLDSMAYLLGSELEFEPNQEFEPEAVSSLELIRMLGLMDDEPKLESDDQGPVLVLLSSCSSTLPDKADPIPGFGFLKQLFASTRRLFSCILPQLGF